MPRVLHVSYGLERGGIETWLLALASHLPQGRFDMVLAHHSEAAAGMSAALRQAGYRLHRFPSPRSPRHYLRSLQTFLRDYGPFQVLHSHVNFAGLLMYAARRAGVPVRIAHSHVGPGMRTRGVIAGSYVNLSNKLLLSSRTHALAVSEPAAVTLFGDRWWDVPDLVIMPCGIDLAPFITWRHTGLRGEFGIPSGRKVLMMIGRLSPEKNYPLALRCMRLLRESANPPCMLIVGGGPERASLDRMIADWDLREHVILLGERADVPALLMEVADVLLHTSVTEGSPLTVVEALAAGLPCIVSKAIPSPLALRMPGLIRVAQPADPSEWVAAIRSGLELSRQLDTLRRIRHSSYDICTGARVLEQIYCAADTLGQSIDQGVPGL